MATGWAEGSSFMLPHDGGCSRTKAVIEAQFPTVLDRFIGRDGFIGRAFSDCSQFFLTKSIS